MTKSNEDSYSEKFITSPTGILRILVIFMLLASAIVFIISEKCANAPQWHDWLFPTVSAVSALMVTLNYALYIFDLIDEESPKSTKIDMAVNLLESVAMILTSVLTMISCNSFTGPLKITGPLGIVAAILLAISTATLYISLINIKEIEDLTVAEYAPAQETQMRKSVVV